MKSISLSVSEDDYIQFQKIAERMHSSVARLIREAMTHYLTTVLQQKPRLDELPVFVGHRPLGALPSRAALYDEVFRGSPEIPDRAR